MSIVHAFRELFGNVSRILANYFGDNATKGMYHFTPLSLTHTAKSNTFLDDFVDQTRWILCVYIAESDKRVCDDHTLSTAERAYRTRWMDSYFRYGLFL